MLRRSKSFSVLVMIAVAMLINGACSIPNLETAECIEARQVVREFYSFHFANEMTTSATNLEARKRFLTESLFQKLSATPTDADVFTTGTTDIPRAFKPGGCVTDPNGRAVFDVLLFWRDESHTKQKTVKVETAKQGDKWLIDRVSY